MGRTEESGTGLAEEAPLGPACGRVAGVGFTGTHGTGGDKLPVRSGAAITWWRTRPPPRHSCRFLSHWMNAALSFAEVAESQACGCGPVSWLQTLPSCRAPQAPDLEAQEKQGNFPAITGLARAGTTGDTHRSAHSKQGGAFFWRRPVGSSARLGSGDLEDATRRACLERSLEVLLDHVMGLGDGHGGRSYRAQFRHGRAIAGTIEGKQRRHAMKQWHCRQAQWRLQV